MPQLQISLPDSENLTHDLGEEKTTIGRLPDNTVPIDDGSVSSHHAEITFKDGKHHLQDLDSTNGTFVNGEPVKEQVTLNQGDEVRFGRIESLFASEEKNTASQPPPESQASAATAAVQSSRPEDFVTTSPVSREEKTMTPLAMAVYALCALALVAAGAAAWFIFSMPNAA